MKFFTFKKQLFFTLILSTFIFSYPEEWDVDGDGLLDNITDFQ